MRLVVSPDGALVVDPRGRLPGRGAWLEPSLEALELLEKRRKSVEKHLGVKLDAAQIRDQIAACLRRDLADGVTMAAAAGALAMGSDAVEQLLRQDGMRVGLFACDAAERTVRQARSLAGEDVSWVTAPWTREEFGALVGRTSLAVVGVRQSRATTFLRRQLRRALRLG